MAFVVLDMRGAEAPFLLPGIQGHECPCSLPFVLRTKQVRFGAGFGGSHPFRKKRGMDGAPWIRGSSGRLNDEWTTHHVFILSLAG